MADYKNTPPEPPQKGASNKETERALHELNEWAKREAVGQYKNNHKYGVLKFVLMIVACIVAILAMIL